MTTASKRNPAAGGPGPDVGGAADAADFAAGAKRRAAGKARRDTTGGARREEPCSSGTVVSPAVWASSFEKQ
jgi:hypothetical protein